MKIGLLDVDGHHYPNLPLMKLSAWHKRQGDEVKWYDPWDGILEPYDRVYMSKVFSFTPDYDKPIYASEISGGVRDTVSAYKMAERSSTKAGTRTYLMRLSISILITRFTRNIPRTRRMAFLQEDAREVADSAMWQAKRVDAVTRLLTSMSFGKDKRTLYCSTLTHLLAPIIKICFNNLLTAKQELSSTKGWMYA